MLSPSALIVPLVANTDANSLEDSQQDTSNVLVQKVFNLGI